MSMTISSWLVETQTVGFGSPDSHQICKEQAFRGSLFPQTSRIVGSPMLVNPITLNFLGFFWDTDSSELVLCLLDFLLLITESLDQNFVDLKPVCLERIVYMSPYLDSMSSSVSIVKQDISSVNSEAYEKSESSASSSSAIYLNPKGEVGEAALRPPLTIKW